MKKFGNCFSTRETLHPFWEINCCEDKLYKKNLKIIDIFPFWLLVWGDLWREVAKLGRRGRDGRWKTTYKQIHCFFLFLFHFFVCIAVFTTFFSFDKGPGQVQETLTNNVFFIIYTIICKGSKLQKM